MRFTRLVAGAATAGLLGITPIAISAPAQATETLATTTTLELPYVDVSKEAAMFGDKITIRGSVTAADGSTAYNGTVTLYQITPGNPAGVAVATVPSGGYISFPDVRVKENSTFAASYSGYNATSAYEDTYTASQSVPVSLAVTRKVVFKNPKSTVIKMKVKPNYKRKPVKVYKKVGKKWKTFKKFKTDKRGKVRFKLPAPRRGKWFWKITVKGSSSLTSWQFVGNTYSYKTATPRIAVNR